MREYYSIHEFSKILGVSAQTLRNWDKNGKLIPHHTIASGYRYYSEEQLNQMLYQNMFGYLCIRSKIHMISVVLLNFSSGQQTWSSVISFIEIVFF